jgi:hypothetical protein
MSRVVRLIDRYGSELDADFFARFGINLDELWFRSSAEPWEKLLELAGQLPMSSRYMAALYDDDEMVAEYVAQHGPPVQAVSAPTLQDWTPERAQLVALTEAITAMHHTLIAVNSKNPPAQPKPLPRPKTAWDRHERRTNLCEARELMARFSPRKTD